MKKMGQWLKKLSLQRKLIIYSLCVVITGLGLLTGTHAWNSIGQSALNMGSSSNNKQEVHLLKLEKDKDGKETTTPIAGATFYLYQIQEPENSQIGSLYTTNKEGKIPVTLAPGQYYFEEVDPSPGYTFDTDENGKDIKRYPFTVSGINSTDLPVVEAYNKKQRSDLSITKKVVNEDKSELTNEQREKKFEFTVTFSDNGTYMYRIGNSEPVTLKSGDVLYLKEGQTAVFTDVPLGVQYHITETLASGYLSTSTNSSGNITEKPTKVSFLNTYNPQVGELAISKTIVNADKTDLTNDQKQLEFRFRLTLSDLNSYTFLTSTGQTGMLKSGDIFKLSHGEILTLQDLPIGLDYIVEELSTEGYISSPGYYSGAIQGKERVTLPFVNQFEIDSSKTGSLAFNKLVVADMVDADQLFQFILTFSDDGHYDYQLNGEETHKHQSGDVLTLKHDDMVTFSNLPAGITYELEEKLLEGYHAQLEEVAGTILSDEKTEFTFHNFKEETASLIIKKIGEGEGFDPNKDFTFQVWLNGELLPEPIHLKAGESSEPLSLTIGDTWLVKETNIADEGYSQTSLENSSGVVLKPNQVIEVTQTNTYTKQPLVKLSGEKKWVFPEGIAKLLPESITVYLKDGDTVVTTQVVKGPDWRYEFEMPKYNTAGEEINYTIEESPLDNFRPDYEEGTLNITNIYLSPVTSSGIGVEKHLVGDKPEVSETFEFYLSPSNQRVSISGTGTGQFEPITFSQAGTYVYTITERNQGSLGYTYDSASYTWSVIVVEKDKKLVIESETLEKNGKAYTGKVAVFENRFEKEKLLEEKIKISGTKKWAFGEQSIKQRPTSITVLLRANDKIIYQQEVTKADKWAYEFTVNKYNQDGKEIVYTIDEVPIEGYQTSIDGFNLTNTYVGLPPITSNSSGDDRKPPKAPGKILPQSNEIRAVGIVIIGAIITMVVVSIFLIRKQNNTKTRR